VPVYVYRCEKCGAEFEDLVSLEERNEPRPCAEVEPCDGIASRVFSRDVTANMKANWRGWIYD
jgi:putative FmdB family regulatory protein